MAIIEQFGTSADFWVKMVEPDYRDLSNRPGDLRAAFHAAISLFHMHDWVWRTHEANVKASFTFIDGTGAVHAVHDAASFANALEQQCADFGRVRGIANAAKHLELRDIRPVANAPSHAANTYSQAIGGYFGGSYFGRRYFGRYFGQTNKVVLEGADGNDMNFSDVADAVYQMWCRLRGTYGW